MQHGQVIDEEGHKADGVMRPNRVVTFTVGRMTRHISLDDFEDLGMVWRPTGSVDQGASAERREPIDSPRFFRRQVDPNRSES